MHNLVWSLLLRFLIATLLRLDWVYYLVYVVGGVWVFSHQDLAAASRQGAGRAAPHGLQRFCFYESLPVRLRIARIPPPRAKWEPLAAALPWLTWSTSASRST